MMEERTKKHSSSHILAIIALCLAIFAIVLAVIFDITAFADVVLQFIAALILPVIAFVVLFMAMIVSFILIFGVYLVKEYGFWPLSLSIQFFKEILADIKVTTDQIETFRGLRVVLILICIAIIVLGIVAKSLAKNDSEKGVIPRVVGSTKGMAKAATILGILGIIVSVAALVIISAY